MWQTGQALLTCHSGTAIGSALYLLVGQEKLKTEMSQETVRVRCCANVAQKTDKTTLSTVKKNTNAN